VRQTPQTSTRIRTSIGLGTGVGSSTSCSGLPVIGPGAPRIIALIQSSCPASESRTGVDFAAEVVSVPTNADGVLYGDVLRAGWRQASYRCTYSYADTSPVAEGARSLALSLTGANGYLRIHGNGVAVSGKSALKFLLHGGSSGGQDLLLKVCVDGKWQTSVALASFGGKPGVNGWKEYAIPLASLKASRGRITEVKIWVKNAQKPLNLDWMRIE